MQQIPLVIPTEVEGSRAVCGALVNTFLLAITVVCANYFRQGLPRFRNTDRVSA